MPYRFWAVLLVSVLLPLITLSLPSSSHAESAGIPNFEGSPFDLVNAVNALRASNGLSPYSVNSILMYTAQSHAEFMAATGSVSHTGAGGSNVTDRLLAAGYPLAGDLSLGGFRSENITSGGESMSAQAAVSQWTGDSVHLNTMLSLNLTEIGAGVAVANGRVYYVIDAARPTTSGEPQAVVTPVGGGSAVPVGEAPIPIAVVSTPNADGDVIHEVLTGQTLWQIAIAYEVKIDDIKRFNIIFDNNIYPGEKLLIKKGVVTASALPTTPPTIEATLSPTVVRTFTPTQLQSTATFVITPAVRNTSRNDVVMRSVIGIIVLALLGGGIFTWLGSARKE